MRTEIGVLDHGVGINATADRDRHKRYDTINFIVASRIYEIWFPVSNGRICKQFTFKRREQIDQSVTTIIT